MSLLSCPRTRLQYLHPARHRVIASTLRECMILPEILEVYGAIIFFVTFMCFQKPEREREREGEGGGGGSRLPSHVVLFLFVETSH